MPIYVYRNLVSGETFEIEQRITEDALSVHPETGEPVKRLIQPVGIAFKGSGFYVNDSRKSASGKSATGGSTDSKGASDGSKSSSGAGDGGASRSTVSSSVD